MKRFYRDHHSNEGKLRFEVKVESSDLLVVMASPEKGGVDEIRSYAQEEVKNIRKRIMDHAGEQKDFLTALAPMDYDGHDLILRSMYESARKANVGPMAAVAGITSQILGISLQMHYGIVDILIENGGDLFLNALEEKHVAIHAGDSLLSDWLKLRITPDMMPLGICTSAGTIGHSLSFGKADAAVVLSKDTALADAVATGMGNLVQSKDDIKKALDYAMAIEGVLGAVVVIGEHLGAAGQVEFC